MSFWVLHQYKQTKKGKKGKKKLRRKLVLEGSGRAYFPSFLSTENLWVIIERLSEIRGLWFLQA